MSTDESKLIARILDGHAEDFGYFLESYGDSVLAMVSRLVDGQADAEDLTQDVFVKAYDKLPMFDRRSSFSTWLYRIAYTTTVSWLRKQKLHYVSIDEHQQIDEADIDETLAMDSEESLARLEAAIEQLRPEEKMLVNLYYYDERPQNEIAYIMGIGQGSVATRLHRIRKKLHLLMTTDK